MGERQPSSGCDFASGRGAPVKILPKYSASNWAISSGSAARPPPGAAAAARWARGRARAQAAEGLRMRARWEPFWALELSGSVRISFPPRRIPGA
eukprot:8186152-Pyramimonas_sp.AAC.1